MSNGTAARVQLNYANGTERSKADIQKVYAVLYDSSGNQVGSASLIDMANGTNTFSFSSIVEGSYRLWLSTDIDGDSIIGGSGEIFETYPSISSNENLFNLDANLSGITVNISPYKTQSSLSSISSIANEPIKQVYSN